MALLEGWHFSKEIKEVRKLPCGQLGKQSPEKENVLCKCPEAAAYLAWLNNERPVWQRETGPQGRT